MKDHHKKESPILTLPSLAGGFTGSAAETYWLATYGGDNYEGSETPYMDNPVITVSSSGDVYIATNTYSTDNNGVVGGPILVKYNKKGDIQWQRKAHVGSISPSIYAGVITALATDSSDNIYVAGSTYSYFSGGSGHGENAFLIKFNSSGTVQWSRMAGSTSGSWNQYVHAMDVDSSDNIWLVARDNVRGQAYNRYELLVIQYNSSGTHQFSRHIGDPSGWPYINVVPKGISVGSDRYSICGHFNDASNSDFRMFLTSNLISNHAATSPGHQFKGQYLNNQNQWYGQGVAHDSSGNIYAVGNSRASNANHVILFKYYDTGGGSYSKEWQQFLVRQYASMEARDIKIDDDGNIYIVGFSDRDDAPVSTGSTENYFIAKYNSSGTLLWSRGMGTLLNQASGYYYRDKDYAYSMDLLGDNVYVAGKTEAGGGHGPGPSANSIASYDVLFAKVPNDGSLAGYGITFTHNTRVDPKTPIYYYAGGYTSSTMNTYEVISSLPYRLTTTYDASSYITPVNVTATATTMDYDSYTTSME